MRYVVDLFDYLFLNWFRCEVCFLTSSDNLVRPGSVYCSCSMDRSLHVLIYMSTPSLLKLGLWRSRITPKTRYFKTAFSVFLCETQHCSFSFSLSSSKLRTHFFIVLKLGFSLRNCLFCHSRRVIMVKFTWKWTCVVRLALRKFDEFSSSWMVSYILLCYSWFKIYLVWLESGYLDVFGESSVSDRLKAVKSNQYYFSEFLFNWGHGSSGSAGP